MDELTALQASYASKMGEKLVELKAVAELIIPEGRSEDIATAISELSGLVHKLSGVCKDIWNYRTRVHSENLEIFGHSLGESDKSISVIKRQELDDLLATVIRRHGRRSDFEPLGLKVPVKKIFP